ncbi:hypothetical protein JCM10213v2_008867 [Rhodosporidiobolus nylandii]
MKLSLAVLGLLAAPGVLAGLEDAKYSTALTANNFEKSNLEPVWTKVAEAFDGDERCKVAHLDADSSAAKPLASKYGVSGYPTIKLIHPPSKGGAAVNYSGPRTEQALLDFLNEKCGTHKLPGGLLGDLAGRIPSLDTLASLYLAPTATRPALLSSASALASSLGDSSSSLASYYLKLFTKWSDLSADSVEDAKAWIEKERTRLGKIASKKGSVAVKKIEEARMKQNILAAFAEASASASSLSSVASATASSASSVVSASASSLSSVASKSGSSVVDAAQATASSVYGQATEGYDAAAASASSAASHASASGSSVVSGAQATAQSAYNAGSASASSAASAAQASASSAASQASKSAQSVYDAAAAAGAQATDAAGSAYDGAKSSAGSAYGEASETVSSVVGQATGHVKGEL